MTASELAYNLCKEISLDSDIQALCISIFGNGLSVFKDSVGTQDQLDLIDDNSGSEPGQSVMKNSIYPQVVIFGKREKGGNVAEGGEFELNATVVIDASVKKDGTDFDSTKVIKDENGVYIYAQMNKVADLASLIADKLRIFNVGAIYQDCSIEYGEEYPAQAAFFTINYKSYQTFSTF